MNRPSDPDRGKVRAVVVTVRVTRAQSRVYESKAKQLGVSVSQWVRSVLDRAARM